MAQSARSHYRAEQQREQGHHNATQNGEPGVRNQWAALVWTIPGRANVREQQVHERDPTQTDR